MSEQTRLTPGHVSAGIAAFGFAIVVGGGLVTLGGMRSRADATDQAAARAEVKADASTIRSAIHEEQIKIIREDLRDVKALLAKIADKVGAK